MGIQLLTPQSINKNKKSVLQCVIGISYNKNVWERTITDTTIKFTFQKNTTPKTNSETPYVECYRPRQRDIWKIHSSHEFEEDYPINHAGILCLNNSVTAMHEDDARKAVKTALNVIKQEENTT